MQRLRVADNGHYLTHDDGSPFVWLADTAWQLVQYATREDIDHYLKIRAAQGYNVVQTVILGEFDGVMKPNRYGELPLHDQNPDTPNERFFEHVDYLLDQAEVHGIYIALLPTWGEWVTPRVQKNRYFCDEGQTYRYGTYLGQRYAGRKNLVFILGGDRQPDEADNGLDVWRTMARGIREHGDWLMSYHCMAMSSTWFANDDWMSFDAFGSYHEKHDLARAYLEVTSAWNHPFPRPILNMEPCYEDITLNYVDDRAAGVFSAADVRKIAYWSVFAGAMGHTYGHNSIWQWYMPERDGLFGANMSWRDVLHADGGKQMQHLKTLMLTCPLDTMIPDQSIIRSDVGEDGNHIRALCDAEGTCALVYIPGAGHHITVDLCFLTTPNVDVQWFNPVNGSYQPAGRYANDRCQSFVTPGEGGDWVLVLHTS